MSQAATRVWRYATPVLLLLVLSGFFYRGLFLDPSARVSPLICQQAPEFALPDLERPEAMIGTAEIAGRMSLLNVWGTWCEGCLYEHAFLVDLAERGMPIFGLNWQDDRAKALAWLEQRGNPYVASAFDEIGDVAIDFGVYGAPETFLISPDQTILAKHAGPLTAEIWADTFEPAMTTACRDD